MLSRPRLRPHEYLSARERRPQSSSQNFDSMIRPLPATSSSTEWSSSLDTTLSEIQVQMATKAVRSGVTYLPPAEARRFSAAKRHRSPHQSATDTDFTEMMNRSSAGEESLVPFTPSTPFTPPPPVPDKDGSTSIMQALQDAFLTSANMAQENECSDEELVAASTQHSPSPIETTLGSQTLSNQSLHIPDIASRFPGLTPLPLIKIPLTPSESSGASYRVSHDTNSLFGLNRLTLRSSAAHGRINSTYPASFSGELDDLADLASIVGKLDGLSKRHSQSTLQANQKRSSAASSEGMITVFLDRMAKDNIPTVEPLKTGQPSSRLPKTVDKKYAQTPRSSSVPGLTDLEGERMAFLRFQAAEKSRIEGLEQWERQERERKRLLRDEMKRDSVLKKLEVEQQVGWRSSTSSLTPSHKSRPASRKSRTASRIATERSPPSEPLPPAPPLSAVRSHSVLAASPSSHSPTLDSPSQLQLHIPGSYLSSPGLVPRQRSASDCHPQRTTTPSDPVMESSAPDPVPPKVPDKTGLGVMKRNIVRQRSESHIATIGSGGYSPEIGTSLTRKVARRHPSYRILPPIERCGTFQPPKDDGTVHHLSPSEGEMTIGSDQKHEGFGLRALRGMPCLPPIATVSSALYDYTKHTRQGSSSSSASRHSSILDYRREKRSLEAQGLEGAPWIARVFEKTVGARGPGDNDEDKVLTKHQPPSADVDMTYPPSDIFASDKNIAQTTQEATSTAIRPAEAVSLTRLAEKEREAEYARQRAVLAEKAALEQVRIARELQRHLERELVEVSKRGRERSEAELAARAQWAREQATRQMLDAFERSKLESEERKRRMKVEALKHDEAARVAAVAKERTRAQQAEKDAIQEARRRLKDLAYREKKLIEDREARKVEEQAQNDKKKLLEERRAALKNRFKGLINQSEKEGGARETPRVLAGWAHVQMGEAMRWKRRYLILQVGSLDLFRDEAGAYVPPSSIQAPAAMESLHVSRISLQEKSEGDAYEFCQMPFSCLLRLSPGVVQKLEGKRETVMVTLSFDTEDSKEEFLAGLSFVIEEATLDESETAYFARRDSGLGKMQHDYSSSSSSSRDSSRS